jgi:hypothetical protein
MGFSQINLNLMVVTPDKGKQFLVFFSVKTE